VLPLVNRTAKALGHWLGGAFDETSAQAGIAERRSPGANARLLELRPDLDQVEGLSSEREALWARLNAATFLTDDEKRAAAGYGAKAESEADGAARTVSVAAKFNPNHDDAGRFTFADGGGGSGSQSETNDSTDRVRVAQGDGGRSGYPVDILAEEQLGGHTIERHIAKPEEYLKARILNSRVNIPAVPFGGGEARAGSFTSVESANKLVNSTMADPINREKVAAFARGDFWYSLPVLQLFKTFSTETGYEAYARGNRQPIMRPTYSVRVRIFRSSAVPKGYYIDSAWPENND
jgi:Bacterial CdiA-CT RNAse A domain